MWGCGWGGGGLDQLIEQPLKIAVPCGYLWSNLIIAADFRSLKAAERQRADSSTAPWSGWVFAGAPPQKGQPAPMLWRQPDNSSETRQKPQNVKIWSPLSRTAELLRGPAP